MKVILEKPRPGFLGGGMTGLMAFLTTGYFLVIFTIILGTRCANVGPGRGGGSARK
jgi:hypothetical protein